LRLLLLEQPVQNSRVSARHVEYLRPARLPRHQRDRLAADTERRSDRSQGCRCRLATLGAGADPDDQRAVVFAAHARMGSPGPDPDGDSHDPSVPGPPTDRPRQPKRPEPIASAESARWSGPDFAIMDSPFVGRAEGRFAHHDLEPILLASYIQRNHHIE
jgi:hypothetical protein